MYQPVLLHTNPVLSYINPHSPIMTKYHQVPTSTARCQNIQMSDFPLSTWDEHSCTLVLSNQYSKKSFVLTWNYQLQLKNPFCCLWSASQPLTPPTEHLRELRGWGSLGESKPRKYLIESMTWYRGKISSFHTTTCLQNIEYEHETIMILTCFMKFQQFCLCLCLCCHIYQLLMILASDSEEASHL